MVIAAGLRSAGLAGLRGSADPSEPARPNDIIIPRVAAMGQERREIVEANMSSSC
jgi:hypothetical protein